MLKWFNKKRKKNNKGFTLVELVIVIAILAILVGLLAPQYTKYVEKSRKSSDVDNIEEIAKAFQVACADVEYNVGGTEIYFELYKGGVQVLKSEPTTASTESTTQTALSSENSNLATAMDATLGTGWQTSTKLKGTWSKPVYVKCKKVASDGSVTVTYSTNVTSYSSKGTES